MNENEIIRDPALARNRIFIGNIPDGCTREELDNTFNRFGTVLAVLIQKNFAFVQFENELGAHKAASSMSGQMMRGNRITVRNAASHQKKKLMKGKADDQPGNTGNSAPPMPYEASKFAPNYPSKDYNDCEIVVVNKYLTKYAEYIEHRLRCLGLAVDILYPNEEVPIGKVLANISSRGCLYAILVTAQNEEHRSITVNILYGQPAEHRNMPVEDAIELIVSDFRTKMKEEQAKKSGSGGQTPMAVPIIPAGNSVAPPLKERHPDAVQTLLNLLADNLPLTVLQYDRIIKYLQERRELQLVAELGENANIDDNNANSKPEVDAPDPEIELQKKILNILNKSSSITETPKPEVIYPTIKSLEKDNKTIDLLKDSRIQRALDSLMTTNLVSTIENHYKF